MVKFVMALAGYQEGTYDDPKITENVKVKLKDKYQSHVPAFFFDCSSKEELEGKLSEMARDMWDELEGANDAVVR